MSGSVGDGDGTVYLAHAWCTDQGRRVTAGSWHWWGVYKTPEVADQRAVAESRRWQGYGEAEVISVRSLGSSLDCAQMVRREAPNGQA